MVVYSWRLLLIAAIASFCANWQFAFQITYVNTSARTFHTLGSRAYQNELNGSNVPLPAATWDAHWSTIVSAFYPGSILGFLLMPALVRVWGVKVAMSVLCVCAIIGCIVQMFASAPSISLFAFDVLLCVGRFLVGIQGGASLCFLPIFIMQISNAGQRSLLNTFQQVSQAVGTLLGLVVGSEVVFNLGEYRLQWIQLIALSPSVLLILLLSLTPPTPHYLLDRDADTSKVIKCLKYYQGSGSDMKALQAEYMSQKMVSGTVRRVNKWTAWKGFFIGAVAAISYSFTADDLIDTFSSRIIHNSHGPSNGNDDEVDGAADVMSIILGCILVLSSFGGSFLVDRFGRRLLILVGLLGTAVFNTLAAYFLLSKPTLVLIFFGLTKASIGLGAGAPAWFLTSELVPLSSVPLFQSISTGLLLCSAMIITFFFLRLSEVSAQLSFIVLSSAPSLLIALILFLFLPETKDLTYIQVERLLSSRFLSGFSTHKKEKDKVFTCDSNSNTCYGTV